MSGDTVMLKVGEIEYRGWEKIAITRSMETFCGAFELQVTERWPGAQAALRIQPGQRASLAIGDDTVITGYVDDVDPVYDAQQHYVEVKGRDAAGDLVDCSTLTGAVNLPTGPAISMIQKICEPFGILVAADVPEAASVVTNMQTQGAEAAFELISRIAEQAGFLVVSDSRGGLRLTNAGSAGGRAAVILGKNILAARGFNSMKQRFSEYVVAAQTAAGDLSDPTITTVGQGKATDPNVSRYRPLVIMADMSDVVGNYLDQRAQWEAAVRLGRSFRPMITVRGWRDDAGALWAPNTTVQVTDGWLAIDATLLVSGVRYLLDDEAGTRSELTLTFPQAFQPAPIPPIPALQGGGGA